jgi:transposase-like protein
MDCPKCKSRRYIKAGIINGRQRYKCRGCHYLYTVIQKSTSKPMAIKRYALYLYLEGLGFRSIGRILGVSNVSVLKWIRAFGEQAESIKSEQHIDIVEMDELHTYIGQKNATAGYGLLLIGMGKDLSTSYLVTVG